MKLILSECINEVNIDAVTTKERGIGTESRLKSKLGLRLMYAVLCVYMCLNYFFFIYSKYTEMVLFARGFLRGWNGENPIARWTRQKERKARNMLKNGKEPTEGTNIWLGTMKGAQLNLIFSQFFLVFFIFFYLSSLCLDFPHARHCQ